MINEQLVRQIVQSVLEKLTEKGILAVGEIDSAGQSLSQIDVATKSLICEQDIMSWAANEIKTIPVLPGTLITPLARDRMQQLGMSTRTVPVTVTDNSNRSGIIAIVAPRCYKTFVQSVHESIEGHGFESHEIETRIRSQSDLENLNARIARQIAENEFAAAVVIDELDRRLGSQANRIDGICAAIGRGSAGHNMIFISQRRWGMAAAAHVINEWLKARAGDVKSIKIE